MSWVTLFRNINTLVNREEINSNPDSAASRSRRTMAIRPLDVRVALVILNISCRGQMNSSASSTQKTWGGMGWPVPRVVKTFGVVPMLNERANPCFSRNIHLPTSVEDRSFPLGFDGVGTNQTKHNPHVRMFGWNNL
jgi:hypothetical protein